MKLTLGLNLIKIIICRLFGKNKLERFPGKNKGKVQMFACKA